jgi:hypothetical protein
MARAWAVNTQLELAACTWQGAYGGPPLRGHLSSGSGAKAHLQPPWGETVLGFIHGEACQCPRLGSRGICFRTSFSTPWGHWGPGLLSKAGKRVFTPVSKRNYAVPGIHREREITSRSSLGGRKSCEWRQGLSTLDEALQHTVTPL